MSPAKHGEQNGNSIIDASSVPRREVNNADRDYSKAHKANPNLGLLISKPLVSRLMGERIVVLTGPVIPARFGGDTIRLSPYLVA